MNLTSIYNTKFDNRIHIDMKEAKCVEKTPKGSLQANKIQRR